MAILSQVIFMTVLQHLLQTILSSIMITQILAHLPVLDLQMTAQVRQNFQIVITIVSLDIFDPDKIINAGF